MSRADEIEAVILERESAYSQSWFNDLQEWLSDREDAELVEIFRGCASQLAWRMVTPEHATVTKPSKEVFVTALDRVGSLFKDSLKAIGKDE